MKLGVAIPAIDPAIGGDPAGLQEFAQAAEDIGYQDLAAPDHVLLAHGSAQLFHPVGDSPPDLVRRVFLDVMAPPNLHFS
jgi:hypothetical protein